MRRFRTLATLATATLALAACGGDGDSTAPTAGTVPTAVINRFNAVLTSPAGQANPLLSTGLGFAVSAMGFGARPSPVTVNADLQRVAEHVALSVVRSGVAAQAARAGWQAVALDVTITNYPGLSQTGSYTMAGVVSWETENDIIWAFSAQGLQGATGTYAARTQGTSAVWFQLDPTLSIQRTATGGACANAGALPRGYTCSLATFTASFNATNLTPLPYQGNTATGSRTASMPTSTVGGARITLDYAQLGR